MHLVESLLRGMLHREQWEEVARWSKKIKKKALVFSKTTSVNSLKRRETKGWRIDPDEFCCCRLVISPPVTEAPVGEKNIPQRTFLVFSIRKEQKLCGCRVFYAFGKCCSSLRTLPGAHPACEIFNMRIVLLCSNEMMVPSFWNLLYILFIWFVCFSLVFPLQMACTTLFLADFGDGQIEYTMWMI